MFDSRISLSALLMAALCACSASTPEVVVDTESLDFGAVELGSAAQRTITVTNSGSGTAALRDLQLLGGDGQFGVDSSFSAIELPDSAHVSLVLTFRPKAMGAQTAALTLSAGEVRKSIALRGDGVAPPTAGPRVSALPRAVDFGDCVPGAERRIFVSNVGDTPLRFGMFVGSEWESAMPELDGADSGAFQARIAEEFRQAPTLAPGAAVELTLRVVTSAFGRKHALLHVWTDDPAQPGFEIDIEANVVAAPPCSLAAEPGTLGLASDDGAPVVRSFLLRTLSDSAAEWCVVRDLKIAPGSSSAFSLVDGPIAWAAIRRGEPRAVQVQFEPGTQTIEVGAVQFEVDGTAASTRTVRLLGSNKPNSCVLVAPSDLDFGTVPVACASKERPFELYNVCPAPATIESIDLETGGPDFAITQKPALPRTLASGEVIQTRITYQPAYVGEDTGTLVYRFKDGTTTPALLQGRSVYTPPQTDVFQMPPLLKVDYLFVIDDSPSMADKQQALASHLEAFFKAVSVYQFDYRFAVTTTAVDAAHGGTGSGVDFANGRFVPLTGAGPRVITPTTPDKAQVFAQNSAVGASSACDGFLLRPMQLALSEPLLSTHNAGFLRPDAHLAVILITDGADHDPQQLAAFQNFLINLKGYLRANMVSFSAIMPTLPQPPAGCTYGEADAGASTRVKDFVRYSGGLYDEICSPDWHHTLQHLGPGHYGERNPTFFLSNVPDLRGPNPIVVEFDGVRQDAVDSSGITQWRYDARTNRIEFEPLGIPEPGSTVTVTYKVACPSER